jgi:hypothetical protein
MSFVWPPAEILGWGLVLHVEDTRAHAPNGRHCHVHEDWLGPAPASTFSAWGGRGRGAALGDGTCVSTKAVGERVGAFL